MDLSLWLIGLENSLRLVVMTAAIAALVGVATGLAAWRGGHALGRLLPLLSLAVPPYLVVFCLAEVFASLTLEPWWTAAGVLGLCNSAFVHAPLASYLARHGDAQFEAVFVATGSRARALLHVLRPALTGAMPMGLAIVGCEALGDVAVSRYYGIQSLVVMVFNGWAAAMSLERIAPGLMLLAAVGLAITALGRRAKDLPHSARRGVARPAVVALACAPAAALLVFCATTFALWMTSRREVDVGEVLAALGDSALLVAASLAGCAAIAAFILARGPSKGLVRASLFAYSFPGAVLAAVMLPLIRWLPHLVVLNVALIVRFACLIVVNVDAAMQSQRGLREMLAAACAPGAAWRKAAALFSPGVVTGLCLVALDVLRELPLSRLLQPFNFSTLAMRVHYLSQTEMLSIVAPEGLVLLGVGVLVTAVMIRVQYAFTA